MKPKFLEIKFLVLLAVCLNGTAQAYEDKKYTPSAEEIARAYSHCPTFADYLGVAGRFGTITAEAWIMQREVPDFQQTYIVSLIESDKLVKSVMMTVITELDDFTGETDTWTCKIIPALAAPKAPRERIDFWYPNSQSKLKRPMTNKVH